MKYKTDNKFFDTLDEAQNHLMQIHPELRDDDMPDFFNNNIEDYFDDEYLEEIKNS